MQQQRGILKAIYVTEDTVTYATVDVDQIGVLANLQSLVNSSCDASTWRFLSISIKSMACMVFSKANELLA